MNYNLDKFKNDFIDFDFDEKLIQQNNELLNSNEHYLQHKNEYLIQTNINYISFSNLVEKYNELVFNYTKDHENKKYIYRYINNNTLYSINEQLKTILLKQGELYIIFTDYIEFLSK